MTDHGILFKGRLVRSIQADEKSETRRVGPGAARWLKAEAGDLLWVRETWGVSRENPPCIVFRADYGDGTAEEAKVEAWRPSIHLAKVNSRLHLELTEKPWREPLQAMSERNAIAEGVKQNGRFWFGVNHDHKTALDAFECLWDSVNDGRGYGWKANPEVVVLRFKRLPSATEAGRDD